MLLKMKRGTKVGWLLVAAAILLSLWVIVSQSASADKMEGDFVLNDAGTDIISYSGTGSQVAIPVGVTSIPANFFAGNSGIQTVIIPSTVTSIGSGAFKNCTSLSTVQIVGTSISQIPASCFEGCTSLTSVTMPGSVTSIGSRAFANCVSLEIASIQSGVSNIAEDAFEGCYSLSTFEVGSESTEYVTIKDCLYDITMTKLLMVPPTLTSVKFADTCTTIGTGAFSQNTAIASLVIPSTVHTIEANAFSGSKIADVSIPASVKNIGTQDNWSPFTIYGYENTAAETFAYNKGTVFVLLSGSGSGNTTNELTPAPGTSPAPSTSTQPAEQQPQVQINNNNTTNNNAAAGSAATSTGKDKTPATADGDIDARWFLIIAVFLGGIAVVFYSRMRKLEYVTKSNTKKNSNDLDS